ncbi:hypothetical protein BGZ65_007031, partial [Modicella reniformis]
MSNRCMTAETVLVKDCSNINRVHNISSITEAETEAGAAAAAAAAAAAGSVTGKSVTSSSPYYSSSSSSSSSSSIRTTRGSLIIHDAPLFGRYSARRRWPPGGTSNDAPKYRILEGQEDRYRFTGSEFNPYVNYPTNAKAISLLSTREHEDEGEDEQQNLNDSLFNFFWTINSLPLAPAQTRTEIMRRGMRTELRHLGPSVSLDDVVAGETPTRSNRKLPTRKEEEESATSETASIPSWFSETYRLDGVQRSMVENLVNKIQDEIQPLPKQELANDLQRLGRVTLLRWGLPLDFVDAPVNQEDSIGVGLEVLISTLPQSNNNHWAGTLVDLLREKSMIKYVNRTSLGRLYEHVSAPNPTTTRSIGVRSLRKERSDFMIREMRSRRAKKIGIEYWKTLTRRFRLQLALARETGIMPHEKEYAVFMKHCLRVGQYRELEMTFHHYMDFCHNAPSHVSSEHQQQQQQQRKPSQVQEGRRGDATKDTKDVSEQIFREYIKGLVRQERMEHAQEMFNSMKRYGISPSVITFGVMIDGYGRDMSFRMMEQTLQALQASGQAPTIEIYTSLMANYIRAGKLKQAAGAYEELLKRTDLTMDNQCRNVVDNLLRLRGDKMLSRKDTIILSGGDIEDELTMLNKEEADRDKELLNNTIRYNIRLKRYLDGMNMPQFVAVYKQLVVSGSKPNVTTYNILQDALLSSGQLGDGLDVLEYMKTLEETLPDVVTFTTLMNSAIEYKNVNVGWSLYKEMRERSIDPTLHTYVTLFSLISLDPSTKVGRWIVREHYITGEHRIRFPVKSTTVEDMIGLNFAGELYNQLLNQGLKPNQHVFCSLLDLTVRHGLMDLSQHVYLEMLNRNVQPNTAIMTVLIKGFAIRRDFQSGWRIWKHMLENNIPRNVITYYHLIRLCERSLQNVIAEAKRSQQEATREEQRHAQQQQEEEEEEQKRLEEQEKERRQRKQTQHR